MNERLKQLRKTLGLTQQEFTSRIGIKRNTMATYEAGRNAPIDAVVSLICREFNVNETWLRTGKGEMFVSLTKEEEVFAFVGDIFKDEDDTFKKRLISHLAALDDNGWDILERCLDLVQYNKE